jgi:hypothetical protein
MHFVIFYRQENTISMKWRDRKPNRHISTKSKISHSDNAKPHIGWTSTAFRQQHNSDVMALSLVVKITGPESR